MLREELEVLVLALAESPAFRAKRDIAAVASRVPQSPPVGERWGTSALRVPVGDDTAAIPDGDGFLLLAAEGILPDFLEQDPYFAGYSAVMVNVSDIAAMGGWPIACVDVYFQREGAAIDRVFEGMTAATEAYGVPLVGGHTSHVAGGPHALAVAILGRADAVLTSFGARAGDDLLLAVDLRGAYRGAFPFWNASLGRAGAELRAELSTFTTLAGDARVHACKDVSNAGIAGTLLMMLEASKKGGRLDLDRLPRPPGVTLARWLLTFPSFGFLLAVQPGGAADVSARFAARGITCEKVGSVDDSGKLQLESEGERVPLWDLARRSFTGFAGWERP